MIEAGLKPEYEVLLIQSDEEAIENKFWASPTVKVNGVDINPMAKEVKRFGLGACRLYVYKDKISEDPPKEMILEALRIGKGVSSSR